MDNDERWIIPGILPEGYVHLLSGPSGAGRSTLAMQIVAAATAGIDWLGYQVRPQRACYVSLEQPESYVSALLKRLALDPALVPHISLVHSHALPRAEELTIAVLGQRARAKVPNLSLLVLDPLIRLFEGNPNHDRPVTEFFAKLAHHCLSQSVTILGVGKSAKQYAGGYKAALERIYGAGAWASCPHTKILLEPKHPADDTDPHRRLIIRAGGKPIVHHLIHDDDTGRLVIDPEVPAEGKASDMDTWLAAEAPEEFSTDDAVVAGEDHNVSRSTVERWLRTCPAIQKTAHGAYKKLPPQ